MILEKSEVILRRNVWFNFGTSKPFVPDIIYMIILEPPDDSYKACDLCGLRGLLIIHVSRFNFVLDFTIVDTNYSLIVLYLVKDLT